MSKVVCIIQARMGSSRLPAKVLRDICGSPMLSHVIQRVKKSVQIDTIVIATTTAASDDMIVELAEKMGVKSFRGSEQDVLSRYIGAARQEKACIVVRITSDCPLIDPLIIDNTIDFFNSNSFDYVQACSDTGFPRGLDTEVFTLEALEEVHAIAEESSYREHVTLYMYRHPEKFKIGYYRASGELYHPDWRLCVDESDDFKLIEGIYQRLYRRGRIVDIRDVIKLLENEPELLEINKDVAQKKV